MTEEAIEQRPEVVLIVLGATPTPKSWGLKTIADSAWQSLTKQKPSRPSR